MARSTFTISLDFELYWGVRDKRTIESYSANLLGVRQAVPRMLDAFSAHGVNATWATVGFVMFDDKDELLAYVPEELPTYDRHELSPYDRLDDVGRNEREDPFHFGLSLVRQIMAHEGQEIGSHTFSHYYCLEEGQTESQFQADLNAAQATAARLGLPLRSLVFPRNQCNNAYLAACEEAGFTSFRGNPQSWIYRPGGERDETPARRMARLLDTYLPISGSNSSCPERSHGMVNVPASRFLRPYSPSMSSLDAWRLERIKAQMTYAAQHGMVYHLWWHPHNFGIYTDENMRFLQQILDHYDHLADTFGMQSRSMSQIAQSAFDQDLAAA